MMLNDKSQIRESNLQFRCLLAALILALGLVETGCRKETPTTQQQAAPQITAQDQAEREREFLADPAVVTSKLEDVQTDKNSSHPPGLTDILTNMAWFFGESESGQSIAKHGLLTLAGRQFGVILGKDPRNQFHLYGLEEKYGPYWRFGMYGLHSLHKIDGKFYEFMLVEDGSKIAARPYRGGLGTIRLGDGGRDLEKMEFYGSVLQSRSVLVPVGTMEQEQPRPVPECELPEGDYTAYSLKVNYANLSIGLSYNSYINAQGKPSLANRIYGMRVRKDSAFVLDLSEEPLVVFQEPTSDKTSFSCGEEIKFAAFLMDPKLDIIIRSLDDTSDQIRSRTSNDRSYLMPRSLDPKVVISRADGEIVAEGVMPFG